MGFAVRGISRAAQSESTRDYGRNKMHAPGCLVAPHTFFLPFYTLAGAQISFRAAKRLVWGENIWFCALICWRRRCSVKIRSWQFFVGRLGFNFSDDSICFNGPAAGHLSLSLLLLYERDDSRGMKGAALLSPANGSAACVLEPLAGNFCLFGFKGSEINALAK